MLTILVLFGTLCTTISLFSGHRSQAYVQKLVGTSETTPPSPPSTTHAEQESVHQLNPPSPPASIIPSRTRELAFAIMVLRLWWQGEYNAVASLMKTANLVVAFGDAVAAVWYRHGNCNGLNLRASLQLIAALLAFYYLW